MHRIHTRGTMRKRTWHGGLVGYGGSSGSVMSAVPVVEIMVIVCHFVGKGLSFGRSGLELHVGVQEP